MDQEISENMANSTNLKVILKAPRGVTIERVFGSHSITIGRGSTCDLAVKNEGLSRKHCLIELEDGEFFVTDLGSTNGVFIQSEKIPAHKRTFFNNYMPLHLAEYECMVTEVDPTVIRQNPIPALDKLASQFPTRSTSKIEFKGLTTEKKTRPKKKNNTSYTLIASLIFGLIVLALGVVQYLEQKESEPAPIQAMLKPPGQKLIFKAENAFLSGQEYIRYASDQGCDAPIYCENLHLRTAQGEGVKKIQNDYLVFFKPSLRLSEPKYGLLSAAEEDMIAMDQILTSLILEDFLAGNVDQIHLIILNNNNQVKKVFRFHPLLFSYKSVSRQELFPVLSQAIKTKNTLPFWEKILVIAPVLDLSNK